jgi:monovalent cation/hydrogen antiporter
MITVLPDRPGPRSGSRKMEGMLGEIAFVLAAVLVVLLVGRLSHRVGLPDAALFTVVGLVYAVLPGPNIRLDPELVLDVVLPPLLYNAALGSSLMALRSRLRTVVSLSVLLVLATALAVGGLLHWLVPIVPLAAAVALGAATAPPDPVAALAIGRRAGLPASLTTLIEGEGLLNDATALTTFQVAVAVAVGGGFSVPAAGGRFLLSAAGGLVVGAVVAYLVRLSRRVFTDPVSTNAISLITPFTAYVLGEAVHVSGVLAVVIAGLVIGYQNPKMQTGASRLQVSAVWRLINFLLEGFVFLLIGQQLPEILRGLRAYTPGTVATAAVVTVGVVLLLRPLWLLATQNVPRWLHARLGGDPEQRGDRALSPREIVAMSWAGTRGVITLAAAFALPLSVNSGAAFPTRDLLLFCAYMVVLVTLLGQGLTFGPLLARLRLPADALDDARLRNQARASAVEAALARLDQLVEEEQLSERTAKEIRHSLEAQQRRYRTRLAYLEDNPDSLHSAEYHAAVQARRAIIDAQHEEYLRWRDAGRLPDPSLRILQRELDHEERALPAPPP